MSGLLQATLLECQPDTGDRLRYYHMYSINIISLMTFMVNTTLLPHP